MSLPLVSVIIPNYNHARYLVRRIESVLNQTYPNFEVIILDDKSTDSSRDIIENYRHDPKVKSVQYNELNSGSPFKQWNRGVKLANGDYIWLAESDDFSAETFLEKCMNLAQKFPEAGLIYCQSLSVDRDSNVLGEVQFPDYRRWNSEYYNNGKLEVKNWLAFSNTLPNASAVVIKANAYKEAGMADESYTLNGDWKLWLRILLGGSSIAYTPETLNYFRDHSEKVTRKSIMNGTNIVETFTLLHWILNTGGLHKADKRKISKYYFRSYFPLIFQNEISFNRIVKTFVTASRSNLFYTIMAMANYSLRRFKIAVRGFFNIMGL